MLNANNNKFYDFINMYNAIIKHCSNKNRHYDIKLFYANDRLYFQVIDKESQVVLHNCDLECTKEESKLIYNMITSEFILNHQLKYAAYIPMNTSNIIEYRKLNGCGESIKLEKNTYFNNEQLMVIHSLENSIFTLNIYQYDGIDEQTNILHQSAINKANLCNSKYSLKK